MQKIANEWSKRNQAALDGLLTVNQFVPVSGDIQSGLLAAKDLRDKNYGSAALNAIGLLPFLPAIGGMIKGSKYSAEEALKEAKKLSNDVKRVANPETFDDSLGGAAWFDRRTPGVYHAIHVTDNPSKAGKVIKQGSDITQEYSGSGNLGELGSGLYVSAVPQAWKSRAEKEISKNIPVSVKGDFIELDRPWDKSLDEIRKLGFDGAYVRGGMGATPQMVIWNNDAIQSFGKFTKKKK